MWLAGWASVSRASGDLEGICRPLRGPRAPVFLAVWERRISLLDGVS